MDENGYNFKLTTRFNDGDVVTEYFRSQRAANRAKQWWVRAQKLDAESGADLYEIDSFRIEAL
jgi:hypothetical protein